MNKIELESDLAREIVEKYNALLPKERIIGDLHFFDENIIVYEQRPFNSVEEMNAFIIAQWNSETKERDTVWVLGDFFDFNNCTKEDVFEILDQLNGNIILIAGNHDIAHLDWYREYGIEVIEYPILKDGFWILSHEPQYVTVAAPYANIFAHVHTNEMYKDVSARALCVSAERLNYKPLLFDEAKLRVVEYNRKVKENKKVVEVNLDDSDD